MSNLYIAETHVNATKHHTYNDIPPYETFTGNLGELYRSLQKEYGRCISAMYIDHSDKVKTQKIGYVFQSRVKYDDCNDTFLREVWVTIFVKDDTTDKLELIDMK